MRIRLLVLLLLISGTVFAQETDWYVNKPIKDVKFVGLDRVSPSELSGITSPFIGKPLSDEVLLDLQRRLYALEYFEYLIPEALPGDTNKSSVIISFSLKERPTVGEVLFVGNNSYRADELIDQVLTKPNVPVSKAKLTSDEEALKQYYLKNGFSSATVTSEVVDGIKPNTQNVRFVIDEGYKTSIKKIQFSGNKFASESTIKALLKSAEQSLFNTGLFQEENLDLDKQAILKYYRENGFVDAKVTDVQKQTESSDSDKRNYLTLTFFIDEGDQWNFGGYTIVGNEIFSGENLMALTHLKPNAILNYTRLQADYQAVADKYYQNGYINNVLSLEDSRNDDTKTISYTIRIIERGRAYIENIIVRGATKTLPEVILRELPFETGDIFSAARIREGLLNLNNKRYFQGTPVPDTPAGSAPGLYDLILNVTEANTTDLRVGFAINGSSDFPLSGLFKWSDSNFLGRGTEIGLEVNLSPDDQNITFSYTDPWLFGPRWSGGINVSFARSLKKDIPQDLLGPIFSSDEDNAVPDPFQGYYVYSTQITDSSSVTHYPGEIFAGNPTAQQISDLKLVTDYAYAGGVTGIPSAYLMDYTNLDFSVGLSSGIKFRTPLGWLGLGGSASTSLNYVDYDQSIYRPFDEALRDNYHTAQVINRIGLNVSLDQRDLAYDPSEGFYLSQGVTSAGGLLGGVRHYIRTDTTFQFYLTLWNLPVTDAWSFKTVLAFNSSLSALFDQLKVWDRTSDTDTTIFEPAGNYLYTNSMTIARGWPGATNGTALLNNWLELRTAIVPGVLSLDFFFDAVQMVEDQKPLLAAGDYSSWRFGFGGGLRLTNPSLPLRLYLGKRFGVSDDGQLQWQKGNIGAVDSDPTSGIDLIFAFSLF